jgi:hypothetical protein
VVPLAAKYGRRQPAPVSRTLARAASAFSLLCDAWWAAPVFVLLGMGADGMLRAAFGSSAYPAQVGLGVFVLFLLCMIPAVRSMRAGTLDIFELGVSFAAVYFLYIGVRALGILVDPGVLGSETPHPSVIIAGLPQAVWYANLGMVAYLTGYRIPVQCGRGWVQFFVEDTRVSARLLDGVAMALYVLGWLARLPDLTHGWYLTSAASRFAGQVPPTVQTLSYFSILAVLGYGLSLVALFAPGGNRPGPRLVAAVLTPAEFLYAFLIGSKFYMGLVVFILLVLAHYLWRRISPAVLLGTILVFIFIITPIVAEYRNVAGLESIPLRSFGREFPHVAKEVIVGLERYTPYQYFTISSRAVLDRVSGVDGIAVVARGVPQITGYARGASLLWVVKMFEPTAIRPGKYDALARVLSPVPYLFGYPDFSRGGTAITEVAEFYWNFGIVGILAGMCLVGLLHRVVVAWLLHPVSPLRAFTYAILWPEMMTGVEGWVYAIYPIVFRLAALAVMISWGTLWLARREPRRIPAVEEEVAG